MNLRAILSLATLLAAPALAQTKRPMTFEDLQKIHRIGDPQISPSGKWVLFSVTDVDLEKNAKATHLWIVPLAGGAEKQFTFATGESNGRFSPDGKWVLFSQDNQLHVVPFDDAKGSHGANHAVTAIETGADGGLWAPDSKHILFTSSVYPECESKAPMGAKRNEEESGCNAVKALAEAKDPVKAQIFDHLLYRHWSSYQGHTHSHIFYASVPGPKDPLDAPTDLTPASVIGDHEAPPFSLGGGGGYAISPDGKEVAYEVNLEKVGGESTNNDIFTLQLGAEPGTAKKVSTSKGSDDAPAYSPDGKYLAWRSQARDGYESDIPRLAIMDRATSTVSMPVPLLDRWVDEFTWFPDSKEVYFTFSMSGSENIFDYSVVQHTLSIRARGLSGFEMSPDIESAMSDPESGEYSNLVVSPDGKILIASLMTVRYPSELVVLNVEDREELNDTGKIVQRRANKGESVSTVRDVLFREHRLTHLNDSLLNQLDLPEMLSFWFEGANNTRVQGFLIRPPHFDEAKKYPVKFLIHGGPQGAWGDAWSYRWNPELFAANGYVVVMVNPRGSTGYGQKFLEQVSGDWGGRPYLDLMKGLDYAEQHYSFIDKTRECALGASYGGFMADYILTHTHRFACIVTHDGMYNPQSAFGTTEELWFNEWEFRPLASAAPGGVVEQTKPAHPWDFYNLPASQDPFRKFSPMLSIKYAKTPTLVIHGQKDYRLDLSEGTQLFTALQLLNVPSKMLYFPDEGHWVLKPQNSRLWYTTVNDWVDQWTHTNKYAK